jgi:acyl-homoserine lactone acylase PvdQ
MRFLTTLAAVAVLTGIVTSSHAASVTITRDKWGVPHIFIPPGFGSKTAQLKALGFAQTYATAQDRMVQLEFFRRAGKGRLSEIDFLGPCAPWSDRRGSSRPAATTSATS